MFNLKFVYLALPVIHLNYGLSNRSLFAAKSLQLCPTLYDPIDGSPPGSPVPGILQARTPEWVAISFSIFTAWEALNLIYKRQKDSQKMNLPFPKGKVQFSSVMQSCSILCNPMDCSSPGLPDHHQLPEFTQTHVH